MTRSCSICVLLMLGVASALASRAASAEAPPMRLLLVPPPLAAPEPKARTAVDPGSAPSSDRTTVPQLDCSQSVAAGERAYRLADILQAVVCQSAALREGPALSQQAQAALSRARAATGPAFGLAARVESSTDVPRQATIGWQLDWTLYDFGARSAEVGRSELAVRAVLHQQHARALEAAGQAASLHASALSAMGRAEAAAENVRIAGESSRLAQARQLAGAGSISERLQAETALSQARVDHARATGRWLAARAALASAMGFDPRADVRFAPSESLERIEAEQQVDLTRLQREVADDHPRILAARTRVDEARKRADGAKSERWGTLGLSVSGSRGLSLADRAPSQSRLTALEWRVPLFDRGDLAAREMDASAQVSLRLVDLEEARRLVNLQIWQAGQALVAEQQSIRAARHALENAQRSLEAARERYRLGVGSFADLLSAQTTAAQGRFQMVEAQSSLVLAYLQLAAASGRISISDLALR